MGWEASADPMLRPAFPLARCSCDCTQGLMSLSSFGGREVISSREVWIVNVCHSFPSILGCRNETSNLIFPGITHVRINVSV